jgi:hypothetical protein
MTAARAILWLAPLQAEKLNGRAAMVGYVLALGVDQLTGARAHLSSRQAPPLRPDLHAWLGAPL